MAGNDEQRQASRKLSNILIIFSVLYFLTALVLDFNVGQATREELPGNGGIVGPVEVGEGGAVMEVDISQYLSRNRVWSFVTGELLDADRQYLTGFGDELYYEEGYDSDGRWVDSERQFEDKLTIPENGRYYFKFNVESNAPAAQLPPLRVEIREKLASSVPHFAGGLLLLVVGIILNISSGGILATLFSDND